LAHLVITIPLVVGSQKKINKDIQDVEVQRNLLNVQFPNSRFNKGEFTAYKTTDKLPVGGTFKNYKYYKMPIEALSKL